MTKYKEMTIEFFFAVCETMRGKKLSVHEKRLIINYSLKKNKRKIDGLPRKDLLLLRDVNEFALEILKTSKCDSFKIYK